MDVESQQTLNEVVMLLAGELRQLEQKLIFDLNTTLAQFLTDLKKLTVTITVKVE